MEWSARRNQRAALLHILETTHKSNSVAAQLGPAMAWKLLIYDDATRSILAPLLSVKDLRSQGVTLNLGLHSPARLRGGAVPDVPAVYVVEPSEANVERLVADVVAGQYASYHFHFTSSLSRSLLEELARRITACGSAPRVSCVWERRLNFVCPEPCLCTLGLPRSYSLLQGV